jgi:hypothetical protein
MVNKIKGKGLLISNKEYSFIKNVINIINNKNTSKNSIKNSGKIEQKTVTTLTFIPASKLKK